MTKLTTIKLVSMSMMAMIGGFSAAVTAADEKAVPAAPMVHAADPIAAGRYLVVVGGCNDCHTANWAETDGALPEQEWLTGVPLGWRGPWGTSYASNLRLLVNDMNEDAWVAMLHSRSGRPPMPWTNTKKLSENDARSLYRFIHSLGARGDRMPVAVEPGIEPQTPYLLLEPLNTN